jgi:hypothetical protein
VSSRALGNARERAVEKALWAFGYRTMCSRASGQRINPTGRENALPGDIIAIAAIHSGLPHILAECGGIGKRLGTTFRELTERGLPGGFVALVARCVDRSWWYYISEDDRFDRLEDALDALRAGT